MPEKDYKISEDVLRLNPQLTEEDVKAIEHSSDATKNEKISSYNATQLARKKDLEANKLTLAERKTERGLREEAHKSNEERIRQKAQENPAFRAQLARDKALRKRLEEEQANALEKPGIQAKKAFELIRDTTKGPRDWIESRPTPGGIATVLIILLFFLVIAIPINANGDTRLKLAWLTLLGRTHMAYKTTTATEITTGVQGNIPMPASGVCPTGYRSFSDSTGFTQCVPDNSSLGQSGPAAVDLLAGLDFSGIDLLG